MSSLRPPWDFANDRPLVRREPEPTFQHYWKCEHYPIAIQNFFGGRKRCHYDGCQGGAKV